MLIKKVKIPFSKIATIGILPSFIKKFVYRMKGYKIGKNVSIGPGSVIIGKKVVIGDNVKIGLVTVIRGEEVTIERYTTIGSFTVIDSGNIFIGEDSRINEQVIVGGTKTPQSGFHLGKRTIVMEYSFINTTFPVTIGDDTGIGGHCLLFTHASWLNQLEGFPVTFAPITIGNNVWLPWRVFIMPGVTIGDKVVVGANSLISKSVKSNCLVNGSPARVFQENYPPSLTDDKKLEIFNSFIIDFTNYLELNGISINKKQEPDYITITGKTKKMDFEVIVILDKNTSLIKGKKDTLVIMNITNNLNNLPQSASDNIMYLDVINKQRIGHSNVGEEFVKFVSRYGLRFARLD